MFAFLTSCGLCQFVAVTPGGSPHHRNSVRAWAKLTVAYNKKERGPCVTRSLPYVTSVTQNIFVSCDSSGD